MQEVQYKQVFHNLGVFKYIDFNCISTERFLESGSPSTWDWDFKIYE